VAARCRSDDQSGDGGVEQVRQRPGEQRPQAELGDDDRRSGTSDPMVPIWIAIEEKFANPARAKVTTATVTGESCRPAARTTRRPRTR
jgi:hypothetical protein